MNSTLKNIEKVPIWKTIFGLIIACLSIYMFLFSTISGIVPIAFSFVLLRSKGSEIDLNSKSYRKVFSILGINIGKWESLPDLEYISVFATTETTTVWASSASANFENGIYTLNLFSETNKKYEVYNTYNKKDAFDTASNISEILIIDLLDATETGDFKWVDKEIYKESGQIVHTD